MRGPHYLWQGDAVEEHGPCVYLFRVIDDEGYNDKPEYLTLAYRVLRMTPKGCWIQITDYQAKERWVPLCPHPGAHFAFPSEEQALYSYERRKHWHVRRLQHQLDYAQRRLAMVQQHRASGVRPSSNPFPLFSAKAL